MAATSTGGSRVEWRRWRRSRLTDLSWSHMANVGRSSEVTCGWNGNWRSVVVHGTTNTSWLGSWQAKAVPTTIAGRRPACSRPICGSKSAHHTSHGAMSRVTPARRPIHLARLDKARPALVLTRATAANRSSVTVAGITSTVHGLPTEVPVDEANGLRHGSVINLDDVQTIPASNLGDLVGYLYDHQESALHAAIAAAFDLDDETT